MFTISIFATFLSAVQIALSMPVDTTVSSDPYNCGYVRTRWNSSVVAGIFAVGGCTPFYYNETTGSYQDAFAYTLYGGCNCRFYAASEGCVSNITVPEYQESTDRWHEPLFAEPRPTWYSCYQSN